ncbi:unnamed protein product, partial [Closterium sp. NIES-54]
LADPRIPLSSLLLLSSRTPCPSHMRPALARGVVTASFMPLRRTLFPPARPLPNPSPHLLSPYPLPTPSPHPLSPSPLPIPSPHLLSPTSQPCAKYLREVRWLCAEGLALPPCPSPHPLSPSPSPDPHLPILPQDMRQISAGDERSKLGDEVWDVMEQVAIAAMDCQQLGIAKCIGALMIAFPNSSRVGRLEGMWLEAKGWWDQADKVYSDLLESNPQDQQVLKRQVAVLKGKGNTVGAIGALKKYLETYMADYEAWKELGDLYLSLHMFKQAAFCYEELLLSAPVNPIYHVTYAEILYSIGGAENYRQAVSHYAAATEYSGGTNLRALYGTCMASAALRSAGKPSRGAAAVEGEPEGLVEATAEAIKQEYRFKRPELLKLVVEPVLTKLVS